MWEEFLDLRNWKLEKLENYYRYNISNTNVDNIISITNFVNNIEKLEKFEDFFVLKENINKFILEIFSKILEYKNDDFNLAFNQWNISKYIVDENNKNTKEEALELKLLLQEKNKFYLDIMSKILSLWKLDNIINLEQKKDLLFTIKS